MATAEAARAAGRIARLSRYYAKRTGPRGPWKGSQGEYFSTRYPTDRRVYVSKHRRRDTLTALDALAAPNLWRLPADYSEPMYAEFYRLCGSYSWNEKKHAADWLYNNTENLLDAHLRIAYDSDAIQDKAKTYAEIASRLTSVRRIKAFCAAVKIEPPTGKNYSFRRCRKIVGFVPWWRRRLSKRYSRHAENGLRRIGFINRNRQIYASNLACTQRRNRAQILDQWVRKCTVHASDGTVLPLRIVRDASIANPVNRRHELMTRLRGMDELAEQHNLVADFYTLTLPSKFHAVHMTGELNDKFNGATVRDGQLFMRKLWILARALLAKRGIFYCGLRVAEPHHDGTPHWHMVLYSLAGDRDALRDVLRGVWLSIDATEPGADKHRIRILACDRNIGSPAGYLAKYISKNIDGFKAGIDTEEFPDAPIDANEIESKTLETCERVLTWARLHGIRQFQFFGTAPVGVWRELRRERNPVPECFLIESARVAADTGEWSQFINAVGGVFAGRSIRLKLWKEHTGEIDEFGELTPPTIVGIEAPEGFLRTRWLSWTLTIDDSAPVTVSDTGPRGTGPGLSEPRGWTNPQETSMYGPN